MGRPRPKMGFSGDVKGALVLAALDFLAERRTSDLSLREVARRVGVSHPAAYHHFASKGALLAAVAARGFERLDALMATQAAEIEDPLGKFVALGLGYVRFSDENPQLFRLMFRRESFGSADPGGVVDAARPSFDRVLAAVGAACAELPDAPDPRTTTVLAWAAMHGLASLWVDGALTAWSGETTSSPLLNASSQTRSRAMVGWLASSGRPDLTV